MHQFMMHDTRTRIYQLYITVRLAELGHLRIFFFYNCDFSSALYYKKYLAYPLTGKTTIQKMQNPKCLALNKNNVSISVIVK